MVKHRPELNIGQYDFKGVFIPKEIWLSQEMTAIEKLIFVEIWALDRKFGCVADNEHFAVIFGIKERTVQQNLKNLKDKELISVEINKADDSRVIRVAGKYARVSEEEMAKQDFLRRELVHKFKI